MSGMFKCRWCDWRRPVWWSEPGQAGVHGGDALVEHCEAEHPDEVERLRSYLNGSRVPTMDDPPAFDDDE